VCRWTTGMYGCLGVSHWDKRQLDVVLLELGSAHTGAAGVEPDNAVIRHIFFQVHSRTIEMPP
jgi:hypothetical protein